MSEDFFSIDKLVEFGMGIGIANQMVQSMNTTMQNMFIPGAQNQMKNEMKNEFQQLYYVILDNKPMGPYTLIEISRLITEKKIVKETYVWKPGMSNWDLAQNVSEILNMVALTPPPVPGN